MSEANTEPLVTLRRRQVADRYEAEEGLRRREQTGSCPNEGHGKGGHKRTQLVKRELSHQYTRALPMPAVRPLFLILHKEDVDVMEELCAAPLSEGFVVIRVDADLNGVMLV